MGANPGDLYVSYSSLEQAADDIRRQANQLKADLNDIQSEVAKVASVWEGEAKTAYETVQRKWNTNVDEVHSSLMQIVTKVQTASGDYGSTDKKAAQAFGG